MKSKRMGAKNCISVIRKRVCNVPFESWFTSLQRNWKTGEPCDACITILRLLFEMLETFT